MARGRMLSKTIATDGHFNKLTEREQWLFMRLLPFADDEGRLPGDLVELRLMCIPGSTINNADMEEFLRKMDDLELIYFDKGSVIQYRNFRNHQTFKYKPVKSKYPNPCQYSKEKKRDPNKIEVPEDVAIENIKNILITFDDFWELGFAKEHRKDCLIRWESIPVDQYPALMRYAKRIIKYNKKQKPLAFLNSNHWITKAPSTNPKDYTQISDTIYRGYCVNCGEAVFPDKKGIKGLTNCCDAEISPYQIIKPIRMRSSDAS